MRRLLRDVWDEMILWLFLIAAVLLVWGYAVSKAKAQTARLAILRHSPDGIAHHDARLAKEALKGFATHLTNDFTGPRVTDKALADWLDSVMQRKQVTGDVLILYTIGHGHESGVLQSIGPRKRLLKLIGDAAVRNDQKVVWWQLSCHACAGMPDKIPEEYRYYLSVVNSSPAWAISMDGVQGPVMKKAFGDVKKLDSDGDGNVTLKELAAFLNGMDRFKRGDLVRGDPDTPLFSVPRKKKEKTDEE